MNGPGRKQHFGYIIEDYQHPSGRSTRDYRAAKQKQGARWTVSTTSIVTSERHLAKAPEERKDLSLERGTRRRPRTSCISANSRFILAPPPVNLKPSLTSQLPVPRRATSRSLPTQLLYRPLRDLLLPPLFCCFCSNSPHCPRPCPTLSLLATLPKPSCPFLCPRQTPSYGRTVVFACHLSRTTAHVPPFPRRLHPRHLASGRPCESDLEQTAAIPYFAIADCGP